MYDTRSSIYFESLNLKRREDPNISRIFACIFMKMMKINPKKETKSFDNAEFCPKRRVNWNERVTPQKGRSCVVFSFFVTCGERTFTFVSIFVRKFLSYSHILRNTLYTDTAHHVDGDDDDLKKIRNHFSILYRILLSLVAHNYVVQLLARGFFHSFSVASFCSLLTRVCVHTFISNLLIQMSN